LDNSHNIAEGNILGGTGQSIAARRAPDADQDFLPDQLLQHRLQITGWYPLSFGNVDRADGRFTLMAGDIEQMDAIVGQFLETFKEFPPRSFPPSFNPATVLEETLEDIRRRRKAGGG